MLKSEERGIGMTNKNRNKRNQPPTGQGKRQSPYSGAANKLRKRSVGQQAQRGHPEENIGTSVDEVGIRSQGPLKKTNSKRPKAGR